MLDCHYCGKPHEPAARDNDSRPVCAICACAFLRLCPDPLLLPSAARLLYWREPTPEDVTAPTWEVHIGWEAR